MTQRLLTAAMIALLSITGAKAEPQVAFIDNGRGDVPIYFPSDYDGSQPLPLIVGLHGYSPDPGYLEPYFGLTSQIESKQFLYATPSGVRDGIGFHFWDATDACCDFLNRAPDDATYLRGLVDVIRAEYAVDDHSIHFTGHSNGGFMSHRMAIDHADLVASIASLAGANFANASAFQPSEAVHALQIHGTADDVIRYDGGALIGRSYPSAEQTAANWAAYNGLDATPTLTGAFDMDAAVAGDETTSYVYGINNPQGVAVELWTMTGSAHSPAFQQGETNLFAPRVVDWLLAHRKPSITPGDYNADGLVDAADYTLWRDGATPDPTATGYERWRDNYGVTEASSPIAGGVPEPNTAMIATLAMIALAPTRARRQARG